jgi:hypothetical protein
MMSKLNSRQIVLPSDHVNYTDEYLAGVRRYMMHVINPQTRRCYCGRNADGWDMPYREIPDEIPTIEEILQDSGYFCRQCIRCLRRRRAELEAQKGNPHFKK